MGDKKDCPLCEDSLQRFDDLYQSPSKCCMSRLTALMPIQQQNPIISGFPPVLMSFTMLVLRPIAAIASTIKNLDSSLTGAKKVGETPMETATVVMMDAPIK